MYSVIMTLKPKMLEMLWHFRRVTYSSVLIFCGASFLSVAVAQGITAADLNSLKGTAGLQGGAAGAALGGGLGMPSMLGITLPGVGLQEEVDIAQDDKKQ